MSDLPTIPSFRNCSDYATLFERLREAVDLAGQQACFVVKKERIEDEYKAWEDTFFGRHTSTINRKIQFYKIAQEAFPEIDFGSCDGFLNAVLSHLPAIGQSIEVPSSYSRGRVVRREITTRLGVLFTIELDGGALVSHEFFD